MVASPLVAPQRAVYAREPLDAECDDEEPRDRAAPARADSRSFVPPERCTRGNARPRARHLAAQEAHAPRLPRVRARRLALHGAGLLVVPEPAPPPHRVPLAPGLE